MSFLKPNYNKPGPGVEKDETPAPGFIHIWKLYFRNFNKMLMYGVIYFLVLFPLICFVFYFITVRINPQMLTDFLTTQFNVENELTVEGISPIYNPMSAFLYAVIWAVPSFISIPLIILAAICYGPLTCGIVFCMRNHTREEHVWFTDLFVRAWRNVKQGLFFGFLDLAIVLSTFIYLFGGDSLGMPSWMFQYLRIIGIAIFVVYMVMRWYIYQMAVTFNLKISGLLKNAWMFVILGLGRNLIAGIISTVFVGIWILFPFFYPSTLPFVILLMISLFWSFLWFFQVFSTYPVMHKYLVGPALAEREKKEAQKRRAEALRRREAGELYDPDDLDEDSTGKDPQDEEDKQEDE